MENIVYKAKGLKKSNFTLQCVLDIVLLIIGIAALFLSQMKHKTTSVSFYTSAGASLGSGDFGGGYVFKEDARNVIFAIGIILIVLAAAFFESVVMQNKSFITLFDNHIEAMQRGAFFIQIKKPVNVTYEKINDVQLIKSENALNTDKVVLYTTIGKYILTINGSDKAYEIIKDKIENK